MATSEKWSRRELERQINGALFERVVLWPTKLSAPPRELHPDAGTLRGGSTRAGNMSTGPPRRSPPREAARGFWIGARDQREPVRQGTGRSDDAAHWRGSLEGGLGLEF